MPDEMAAPRAVDVTFTLPGEVGAGHVALCGDFNDWSAGSIALHRGRAKMSGFVPGFRSRLITQAMSWTVVIP